jgi:hypothetical protein
MGTEPTTKRLRVWPGHNSTPPIPKGLKHLRVSRRATWCRFAAASVPIVCPRNRPRDSECARVRPTPRCASVPKRQTLTTERADPGYKSSDKIALHPRIHIMRRGIGVGVVMRYSPPPFRRARPSTLRSQPICARTSKSSLRCSALLS